MTATDLETLITSAIGPIGRYQILIILMLCICKITESYHLLLVVIVSPPPGNFTCVNSSLSECDENCPGHKFDHSVWENTIIHEWDLVCRKKYVSSFIQSIVMLGLLSGNVVFGFSSDRFGRFAPLIFCVILQIVAGISTTFSSSVWIYTALRFLSTFSVGGTMLTTYAIVTEITDSKYRPMIAILFALPCNIGHGLLGLIGYYSRRWDHIQLIVSVPSVTMLSYFWIPESSRWLLTVHKSERAIKTLETGARCNNLPTEHIRTEVEKYFRRDSQEFQKKGGNVIDLFRTKRMRIKTIVLFTNWTIVSMSFFGISQYVGQISGNVFMNIAASGLIQVPGVLLSSYLIEKLGRKWCIIFFYSICFISMFAISLLPDEPTWPIQMLACLSVLGIFSCFSVTFAYSAELYPTIVRTIGLGMSSMCARVGAMIAPFLTDTRRVGSWLPPLLFGIFPVIASVLIFCFLPETKGTPFPDTIEEADQI